MRHFLAALTLLSTVVMAQSVVAITPVPTPLGAQLEALDEVGGLAGSASGDVEAAILRDKTPGPVGVFLLLVGLSGLTAAGNRPNRTQESSQR